ncbi:MAG: DUF3343 domain-containing protein [Clostridiales bacterium]|nr:DUF3343 domain-containing protein [Clostridiales bacterium]
MNYIFSFSSRNSALRFYDAVIAAGGKAKLTNAPIASGTGCGLAVKSNDYHLCQNVLNFGHYNYLREIYEYDGQTYKSLYRQGNY